MKIHEYQGKMLLRNAGVPVPRGDVATSPQSAQRIAETLDGHRWVVKAQIHAGGRGKGGGIKLASSPQEVGQITEQMLGRPLVTLQTGSAGQSVHHVLVEECCDIADELYCGLLIDRSRRQPLMMVSPAGGMNIEEVAAATPEKILREPIDILVGLTMFQTRRLALQLGLQTPARNALQLLLRKLYMVFRDKDCTLLEINPLVITSTDELLALDVKMEIDDNALFRHDGLAALRDPLEEDPLEVEAEKCHLNYIKLVGNVGCIVNGAGLAMATMDIVKLAGASPANFLDVGGGASEEMVENAFRILMSDPDVEAVLINVFGGILRCDVFAQGVVQAVSKVNVQVPVVVRMEGTNVEEGQRILDGSGFNFVVANDLADAAEKVVQAVQAQRTRV
ncbi:MAG: ADP-forming succinate--CoA ligase subunit beta [bacterium]|nr:ADP-forming succinate--CoA ligase subunit beta [bacterium]